jgi:hypothetical protein
MGEDIEGYTIPQKTIRKNVIPQYLSGMGMTF